MIQVIDHRKAFNIIVQDSILIFQFSSNLVPRSNQISMCESLSDAVLASYNDCMENFPPDEQTKALILDNDDLLAENVAAILLTGGYCKKVMIAPNEKEFLERYNFLLSADASNRNYASEILDHLYLGGLMNMDENVLSDQGVTAAVSVYNLAVTVPSCVSENHVKYVIEDSTDSDITAIIEEGSLWMLNAYNLRKHKIFVHCAQGRSRSVSVVLAYLVRSGTCRTVREALAMVKEQRSFAQPNEAFMQQLFIWEQTYLDVEE